MNNETYQKLDRSALWLLVGEFSGAGILLLFLLLMIVGNLISPYAFDIDYNARESIMGVIAFVYGLAYLGNLAIGIIGLYLFVTEKREGYPGTGHLLNWTLVSATLLLAVALILAVFSSM